MSPNYIKNVDFSKGIWKKISDMYFMTTGESKWCSKARSTSIHLKTGGALEPLRIKQLIPGV